MTDKLEQTIKEEMGKLPKDIQDIINTFDWVKITEVIGNKYNLNEDEIEDLQLETLLVLIGVVDGEFYAINIENQVLTTKDEAQKIAKEVEEKIFIPIYNALPEKAKAEAYEVKERFPEERDRHLGGLPKDIQEKIVDSKYQNTMYEIAEDSNLTVAQMGLLEECVDDVILGVTPPDRFQESVRRKLGLPEDKTRLLVNQINEKILKQIRKKMMGEPRQPEKPAQISQEETEILGSHGIEILGDTAPTPSKDKPILTGKLSGSFQNPIQKTDYTKLPAELKTPELPSGEVLKEIEAPDPYKLPPE